MIRAWIGVALLAGSWLLGFSLYEAARPTAWLLAVVAGTALLSGVWELRNVRRWPVGIALTLLLYPAWLFPWPDRVAPLWIAAGLLVELLPAVRPWIRRLGGGAIVAGVILLAQSLTLAGYTALTARWHDLPAPFPTWLAFLLRLLGIDAAAGEGTVAFHSLREARPLAVTWDLLLDPSTLCFAVGAMVLLALVVWSRLVRGRWTSWGTSVGALLLALLAWIPMRAALLVAVCVHRELRADYDVPLHVINHLFASWVQILLLAVPVVLARWLTRVPAADEPAEPDADSRPAAARPTAWRETAVAALLAGAGAVWAGALYWEPIGRQKAGNVMVVERHSTWESTTRPYDTTWYGEPSGYNYAAMHDCCAHYFNMSRLLESETIDEQRLAGCDILLIKTPTARYEPQEVAAIVRFVQRGGGLLLMGEHTNLDRGGTYLNDIARHFGFLFRYDLLFGVESAYDELYTPPTLAPHPIVQHVPALDFAISCSIDPGASHGRAVICNSSLWSLPPEYHRENFFPLPYHHPDMRCGAFIQLWATRYGSGRVAAFTDSTQFSNFSAFEPGKLELMLGMLQWLNYSNLLGDVRTYLLAIGLILAAMALVVARRRSGVWLVLLAAGMCGFALGTSGTAALHRWALPPLQPQRPLTLVTVDRTVSDAPLANGGFVPLDGEGYGMFELWIPRLGYVTQRREGSAAFSGKAMVVLCPRRSASEEFRQRLEKYVADGGNLLVVDAPENGASTANSLLWPFGLTVHHDQVWQGPLTLGGKVQTVRVERSCGVSGGQPIARLGERTVGAVARHGQGTVLALGFGSLFSDRNMGGTWTTEPDPPTRQRYEVLYAILRYLVEGQPLAVKQIAPAALPPK